MSHLLADRALTPIKGMDAGQSCGHTDLMRSYDLALNGHDFHIREWGDPSLPVLLMLHGFPEYGGAWADLAERLSHRFRCVAPDQRGYGQSWCPEGVENYASSLLAGDMAALAEHLGGADGTPVTLLGHDWGASVAYAFAIRRPELIDRLIILNGVHPAPFRRALAQGGAQTAASQYMTFLRSEGSEDKLAANNFARLLALFAEGMDMTWLTGDRLEEVRREWARPGRLKAMVNWYRAARIKVPKDGATTAVEDMPPAALFVPMPHLLIWGMRDTALLPDSTVGLEDYCADLTRVEIENADHWLVHQVPDQVAETILQWIDART